MLRLAEPLFLSFVDAAHADLARQVQFLRAENRILRSRLPHRIHLSPGERRRLVRLGKPLGRALKHLISIVKFDTFRRWFRPGPRRRGPVRRVGRPGKPRELRQLVVRLARENPSWGYTRILGELRKLGVENISRATVRNILRAHGLEPAPMRHEPGWDDFLKAHAKTLWACDFFTKPVWTWLGPRTAYILFFLHVGTRRVIVCPATRKPDADWSARQAELFLSTVREQGLDAPAVLLRDRDAKFGPGFNAALRDAGCTPKQLPPRSPLLNAFAERWVRSVKTECLDWFIALGERHLDYLVAEYVQHFLHERPHQGLGNRPLRDTGPPGAPTGRVVCHRRLGGVLRHYSRAAA